MSEMIDRALVAKRESKHIEFKRSFDPTSAGAWCELIKDVVAIANSGGGAILIGVENNGDPSNEDTSPVLALDQATLGNALYCHTPKFGITQYSDAFAKWLVDQHKLDTEFFAGARTEFNERLKDNNP